MIGFSLQDVDLEMCNSEIEIILNSNLKQEQKYFCYFSSPYNEQIFIIHGICGF